MDKLDEKTIEKQKNLLLAEKKKLEKKIAELAKFPDYGRADDDNAKETEDFETNLSLETQLKSLLDKTNAALKSVEKGTYGQCSVCKEAIENDRLKLMPYATICISCEKKQK